MNRHVVVTDPERLEFIERMKSKVPYEDIRWRSEENSDLWILDIFKQKRNGTFIEAGAAGKSNCRVLEVYYDWNGVAIEPCTESYKIMIEKNGRKHESDRRNVINKCLYSHNGMVEFYECSGTVIEETTITEQSDHWDAAHLSSVKGLTRSCHQGYMEKYGTVVQKESITLEQVIIDNGLPDTIDYLSMDIENCEREVFSVFPFDRYRFLAMSIEDGCRLGGLLTTKGYVMVENPYQRYEPSIDYYYIHESMVDTYPYAILDYRDYL